MLFYNLRDTYEIHKIKTVLHKFTYRKIKKKYVTIKYIKLNYINKINKI